MEKIYVADVIDRSPLGAYHWRIVLLGGLVMMLDGYDLAIMGTVVPAIAAAWNQPLSGFGLVFSSSFAGVAVGSAVAGMLGDRYGRKIALLTLFLFGAVGCFGSAFATDRATLLAWRVITGVGMGGVIPNIIALATEFMPAKRRTLLVVLTYSGAPLGSTLGAVLAARLIPALGWESTFVVGGVLPIFVALLVARMLPESPRFLVERMGRTREAYAVLTRLQPGFSLREGQELAVHSTNIANASPVELFRANRGPATLLLWTLFIGTQSMVFFLASWLSSLLVRTGYALPDALYAVSLYHFGAFAGGLSVAWLSDRYSGERLLAITYAIAVACLIVLARITGSQGAVFILSFLTGAAVIGASLSLGALAATYYPTTIRSTGVGWGLSAGRLGAIASPLLGGAALSANWSVTGILSAVAIPASVCVIAVMMLKRNKPPPIQNSS